MGLEEYYSNLLIKQYHDKPKAIATVELLAGLANANDSYRAVRDGFDVNTASGAQLDILGNIVGVGRSPTGVPLTDLDYRFLIKMKIIQNSCDQTLKSIDNYIDQYFGEGVVEVVDNLDMTITYQFPLTVEDLMTIALSSDALPRPAGVAIILAAILNPNGTFGYSLGGTADADVNGYSYESNVPDPYEGGTYLRIYI